MEFDGDVAEPDFLTVANRLRAAREIVAIAQPHHVEGFPGRQHVTMTGAGVVGMAVGDNGALDRANRIDMKAAGLAAKAGGNWQQYVLRAHASYIGGLEPDVYPSCAGLTRASIS